MWSPKNSSFFVANSAANLKGLVFEYKPEPVLKKHEVRCGIPSCTITGSIFVRPNHGVEPAN